VERRILELRPVHRLQVQKLWSRLKLHAGDAAGGKEREKGARSAKAKCLNV
jgi:hypothetical protein